jgi:hypothetical protein
MHYFILQTKHAIRVIVCIPQLASYKSAHFFLSIYVYSISSQCNVAYLTTVYIILLYLL